MVHDRRQRRALSPLLAAEHYLDAELDRSRAAALFLLDRGEIVASSVRTGESREALGSACAEVAVGRDGSDARDVYAHSLDVPGRRFVLASVDSRVRSVRDVERSIERIFSME